MPRADSIRYTFDHAGNLTSLFHRPWAYGQAGTPTWSWQYDAKNRVKQLTIPTASPGPSSVVLTDRYTDLDDLRYHSGGAVLDSLEYDAAGRVTTLVHSGQTKRFSYDLRGRLDSERVVSGALLRDNTYDALGNITHDGTWAYTYGTTTSAAGYGRLQSRDNGSTTVGYDYDGAGNTTRTGSLTWTTGSTGMTAAGDTEMAYDRWGHMVLQRILVADAGCTVSTPSHTEERRFTYDALGRRVAMFSRHQCASDKGFWRYWWLDDHVAVKQWNLLHVGSGADSADADEAWPSVGGNGHWYAYGPGMDQPLGLRNPAFYVGPELPGTTALTFLRDYRGSVVRTYCTPNTSTGSCGSIESVGTGIDYTAYGSSGAAVPGTPGYNGLESNGGLVYMRNRWYDPNSGRFTQADPIGYAGGINLYAYAGNDPVTFSDPYGLCPDSLKSDEAQCATWNQAQVDAALGVLEEERARGNKHALSAANKVILGLSADQIEEACKGTAEPTLTGCNKGSHVVVNADRTPAAISATIVHEVQHDINRERGIKFLDQSCAIKRAALYVSNMSPSNYTSALGSPLPASDRVPIVGGCGF